ncbi:MAG TPA: secretin N-terminal domain-containing protein [Burkholderiales bacterium]|nr:secretin N-terminal domain-containing protein [Burkholderiales bacterium]
MKRIKWGVAVLCLFIAACADRPLADSERLLSEGKDEAALATLEQAVRDNPQNAEYRARLANDRERVVGQRLAAADALRGQRRFDDAENAYLEVLKIDPDNARGKAGVTGVEADIRLQQQAVRAGQMFEQGDVTGAAERVRAILIEDPDQPEAKSLQRKIAERVQEAPPAPSALHAGFAKPITLEFHEADIHTVFEMISRSSGINFVFDKDIRADTKVTIYVRDTTIDDVIKLIMATNQLRRKILNDNSVLIYPDTPAKIKDYQELVARNFYLVNADAKKMADLIKTVVKTRDIYVNDKLNSIVIRDTPEAVRLAEKLVAAQDLPEPEVMLELEVLEIKRSRLRELGINYPNQLTVLNIVPNPTTTETTGGVVINTNNATTTTTQLTLEQLRGGPQASQIGIPNPALNLKSESSDSNLLANPRIRVKNHTKAKILIGDRVPVITSTSTANVGVSQSVNYLDVGLKLEVEPDVLLDDEVSMDVNLEVSSITREITNRDGTLAYQVGTRNASTALRLKDGETQVLAGLINDEDRRSASKLPGLGDLPIIGKLFSDSTSDATKTEIVLLITPHIVRGLARPDADMAEFNAGTESVVGMAPLQIRPTAAHSVSLPPAGGGRTPTLALTPDIAAAPAAGEAKQLALDGAAEVKLGSDFAMTLAFPPEIGAAEFDLVYDPTLVSCVARAAPDQPPPPDTGRIRLKFENPGQSAGATMTVPCRAVAKEAGSARIAVENIAVENTPGAPTLTPPAPHTVNLAP